MSSAPTALTTKSSIRCTRTPISHYSSITNCAIGNTPTTACALTSRSPTSLLWNSSPVGNFIGERQSVTNLLDEYTLLRCSASGMLYFVPRPQAPFARWMGGGWIRGQLLVVPGKAGAYRLEGVLSLNATSGRVTAHA